MKYIKFNEMKKNYSIIIYVIIVGLLAGCVKEDFLERSPLTAVNPEVYFKSGNDFMLYVNQFYDILPNIRQGWRGWDPQPVDKADNQIGTNPDNRLNGLYVKSSTNSAWNTSYSNIRKINIMLNNTGKADWDEIKQYVAEGRFFRAWIYFDLLKSFGGVPWISKPIDIDDEQALKTPRLPRNILADSIVADLNFAIENLPLKSQAKRARVNKEAALCFKSRVCLYEGTWEKYHGGKGTPFKVDGSDGFKYLQQAMEAAYEIIKSGNLSIYKTGVEPYYNLFNQEDYSSNSEIILWKVYDRSLLYNKRCATVQLAAGSIGGLTKDFIEDFLAADGKPISLTPLSLADDSIPALFQNRDPRLKQTLYAPGMPYYIMPSGDPGRLYVRTNLTRVPTGYHYRKYTSLRPEDWNTDSQIGFIYFRYAEVLLNYIEAKAELNEMGKTSLSQNDFDISINELRDRIGMPHFNYNEQIVDPDDPMTGEIPWYLVEIRRERRIELVMEGFRQDDIFRWAAADELIKGRIFRGAPFQWHEDRGWYTKEQIRGIDDEGRLSPWYNTTIDLQGGYNFNLNRDYLLPLPMEELVLGGYENNPGWE